MTYLQIVRETCSVVPREGTANKILDRGRGEASSNFSGKGRILQAGRRKAVFGWGGRHIVR